MAGKVVVMTAVVMILAVTVMAMLAESAMMTMPG